MTVHDNILHIKFWFIYTIFFRSNSLSTVSQQAYWFGRAEREDCLAAAHRLSYQHSWDLFAAHFFLFCFMHLNRLWTKLTDSLVFKLQCEHLTNTNN